jgi:hypothetical protein
MEAEQAVLVGNLALLIILQIRANGRVASVNAAIERSKSRLQRLTRQILTDKKKELIRTTPIRPIDDAPSFVRRDGTQEWLLNGELHREGDLPAIIRPDGTQEWWIKDQRHRIGKPAIVRPDGTEEWYENDQLHRDGDLPAITRPDGTQEWWFHDRRHRISASPARDPSPAVVRGDGTLEYWINGELSSLDGPAIVRPDGTQEWYFHDQRHCSSGPAVTRPDGSEEWWYHNQLSRFGGPAVTYPTDSWWQNGVQLTAVEIERQLEPLQTPWWIAGQHHRNNGPPIAIAGDNRYPFHDVEPAAFGDIAPDDAATDTDDAATDTDDDIPFVPRRA